MKGTTEEANRLMISWKNTFAMSKRDKKTMPRICKESLQTKKKKFFKMKKNS